MFVSYPVHGKVIRGEYVITVDRTLSTIRVRIIEYGERVNSTYATTATTQSGQAPTTVVVVTW